MGDEVPDELVGHVVRTSGLPPAIARRVVSDVMGYFVETAEEYVRRRHAELRDQQVPNARIWSLLHEELAMRPVVAPPLSERQLRRIVYG
ncbi:hypothetical protein F0L68_16635 [Solihabitans fulvus]|uniref:Uncharacterized protein n=1 Tax=Solihabitans fulvus TaxID=1892852 RepID=A0A5B2XDW2_9PSEU|nr:hypothetical protein [Solihabitans fulvus]KAA2261416.1 hypothetical protein F0L68_16635 [Solihabitans fulvus]